MRNTADGNSPYWEIMTGLKFCEFSARGRCVTDGDGDYGPLEKCSVRAVHPLVMSAVQYDVEERQDYVTVKGEVYRDPIRPPRNVEMDVDDYIYWCAHQPNQCPPHMKVSPSPPRCAGNQTSLMWRANTRASLCAPMRFPGSRCVHMSSS